MSFKEKYLKYRNKYLNLKTKYQLGGVVSTFKVYVFTIDPIPESDKQNILELLKRIYGTVDEIEDYSEFYEGLHKDDITEFVREKGGHYSTLKNIVGFSIKSIPHSLNEGKMNDDKLTYQEYSIRDQLATTRIPYNLVDAKHGLWSEGVALIALEHI